MAFVWVYCKHQGLGQERWRRPPAVWQGHLQAGWALLMPVIILGGIYGGVFTPTEASAVAVFYALSSAW
jgi:C4-dicarboxylate transporter DctM subunit